LSPFSFVVGVQGNVREEIPMFDVLAAPAGLAAGRRLALSAMPGAPVVADRPRTRYTIRRRKEDR
jgi:hypothetical protein